jgi:hypothetical protein
MATALDKPPTWMVAELRRRTGLPLLECRRMLQSATLAEYHRIGGGSDDHCRVDPAEDDPRFATILLRATLEADAELAGENRNRMGFAPLFWHTKQRILRDRYGVEWRTPVELMAWLNRSMASKFVRHEVAMGEWSQDRIMRTGRPLSYPFSGGSGLPRNSP